MKVYYYPPSTKGGYSNPYSLDYKKILGQKYDVLDSKNKPARMLSLSFLQYAFRADIYIVNWLESVCFLRLGWLQYIFAILGLFVIKLRRKKIVWMFHNIHPHQGDNYFSNSLQRYLYNQASLIISHSKEAADYAEKYAKRKVIYVCHPVHPISVKLSNSQIKNYDVFVWGTILPYKGILEFLSQKDIQESNLRIRVLGRCKDLDLADRIDKLCNENIIFENRRANIDEIASCIKNSRYVLFPYIGECVSSSGALIDTLVLGGVPIGPNKGAFKDLSEEKMCFIYNNYRELLGLLKGCNSIADNRRTQFLKENSWEHLLKIISENIG